MHTSTSAASRDRTSRPLSDTKKFFGLRPLFKVQAKALRICCGASRTTDIAALQVEMGEMPLDLRRQQQQIKYASKIKATENHANKNVLEVHWTTVWGKFKTGAEPFSVKVNPFLEELKNKTYEAPKLSDHPPWELKHAQIDTKLTQICNKKEECPDIVLSKCLEHNARYEAHMHIYTDGSKTADGKVAAAFYVPSQDVRCGTRIADDSTVYTAEMTAIKLTLEYIINANISADTRVAVFSDSLSSLTSIETGRSSSKPNLLNNIMSLINQTQADLTFVWIPSHVGILGNETADKLAGTATTQQDIQYTVNLELKEIFNIADKFILKKWQERWSSYPRAVHYKQFEPTCNTTIKYTNKARRAEVLITRLRLGIYNLNKQLKKYKKHPTGNCDLCDQPEDIQHFLIECRSHLAKEIKRKCQQLQIQHNVKTVLTDERLIQLICTKINRRV